MSLTLERYMEEREWAGQDRADSDAGLPEGLQEGWRVGACWAGVVGLQLSSEDRSICPGFSEGKGCFRGGAATVKAAWSWIFHQRESTHFSFVQVMGSVGSG